MSSFEIVAGPLLEFFPIEAGGFGKTFATEADCHQAHAYYIEITNISNSDLWIENVFFRLNARVGCDYVGLLPIFPNRYRSFRSGIPARLHGRGFRVEYVVPFKEIPPVVEEAIGIRIRYRSYYIPLPIYRVADYSGGSFGLLQKALRSRWRVEPT